MIRETKARYIAAITPIALSITITPYNIIQAYFERGYLAFGGEYLMIPLGLLLSYAILDISKECNFSIHIPKKEDTNERKKSGNPENHCINY